ncbi:MAG: FecR domain-containing protein [Burkholderiales bacterium]|nr:FecR domain-containing protein [Burkholderiales bacterium]
MLRVLSDAQLVLLLCLIVHITPAHANTVAEIVSIEGTGQYRDPQQAEWSTAKVKQSLKPLQFVRTVDLSKMALVFVDRTQIRLAPNSVLQIKEAAGPNGGKTVVDLNRGRTWMQSKTAPGGLAVQTPSALASIRGTDWEIEVGPDGRSTLTVLSGEVEFSNAHGSLRVLRDEQAVALPGQAPTKIRLNRSRSRVQWVAATRIDASLYRDDALTPARREVLERAIGLIEAEKLAEAADTLRAAVAQVDSASLSATLLQAELDLWSGRVEAVEAMLAALPSAAATDVRVALLRIRIALQSDRLPDALVLAEAAAVNHPNDVETVIARAELRRLDGRMTEAAADYRRARMLAPSDPRGPAGLGLIAADLGELEIADQHFAEALSHSGKASISRSLLQAEQGAVATARRDLTTAAARYREALEGAADNYVALTGLGIIALTRGDNGAALDALTRATVIEPGYARALLYQAVAYHRIGRRDRAAEMLERVSERDPRDPLPHVFAALIGLDAFAPGAALVEAEAALAKLPNLKSFNLVASNQAGSANLGSALVQYGLEGWARHLAQESALPFWAPSHLFQADRQPGAFTRRSALMQGFLVDPLVFGAGNRAPTLVEQSERHGGLALRLGHSDDQSLFEPVLTLNGLVLPNGSGGWPLAWFAELIETRVQGRNTPLDANARTISLGLGMKPRWNVGFFLYANQLTADIEVGKRSESGLQQRVDGRNRRIDAGMHWAPDASSQWWLKAGRSQETSQVAEQASIVLPGLNLARASDFSTRPTADEVQARYTRIFARRFEFHAGAEWARTRAANALAQEPGLAVPGTGAPRNRLDSVDADHSTLARAGIRWTEATWTVEAAAGHIRYAKDRAFIATLVSPPATQSIDDDLPTRRRATWSVGMSGRFAGGITLRTACEDWVRPASSGSLLPLGTAGIIFDDQLVFAGGRSERCRAQLDWPVSRSTFLGAHLQHQRIANLFSLLDGVLNTRADVTNLDRLRNRNLPLPPKPDALEDTSVFSLATQRGGGINVGHIFTPTIAAQIDYLHSTSQNTGPAFPGRQIPWLPRHRLQVGGTLSLEGMGQLAGSAIYRSRRYADEANLQRIDADWDLQLRWLMEFERKRWSVEAFAVNLLRKSASDSAGVVFTYRF